MADIATTNYTVRDRILIVIIHNEAMVNGRLIYTLCVSCFTLYVTFALKISTTIVDKRGLV